MSFGKKQKEVENPKRFIQPLTVPEQQPIPVEIPEKVEIPLEPKKDDQDAR